MLYLSAISIRSLQRGLPTDPDRNLIDVTARSGWKGMWAETLVK